MKGGPPRSTHRRGLTLVELLTLLVLLVILAAISIPSMSPVVLRYRLRGAAWQVAGDLRLARQQAVSARRRFRICLSSCAISVPDGAYSVEREDGAFLSGQWASLTGAVSRIPEDVALTVNRAPVFWADGAANPMCTFTVTNRLGQYQVAVASTGRVRVCEGTCQ